MVRADYCGTGRTHTRDGTSISFHRAGQTPDSIPQGMRFEAAWSAQGAVCVRRTRFDTPLEDLERECPRLKGHLGDTAACEGGGLINASFPLPSTHSKALPSKSATPKGLVEAGCEPTSSGPMASGCLP
jgi:ADYC domain